MASMATRIPVPAAFLIASEVSFGVQLRSIWTVFTVGTSFLATSRRDACKSVMTIGVQPAAWEARRVTKPIGPAPLMTVSNFNLIGQSGAHQIKIGSPRRLPALSRAAKATARGSHNAPSSYERLSGRRWSQEAGWA